MSWPNFLIKTILFDRSKAESNFEPVSANGGGGGRRRRRSKSLFVQTLMFHQVQYKRNNMKLICCSKTSTFFRSCLNFCVRIWLLSSSSQLVQLARGVDVNKRTVTTHSYSQLQRIKFGHFIGSCLFSLSFYWPYLGLNLDLP